jgi:predicted flap endonuclease-1-like 5' DNA nuclease
MSTDLFFNLVCGGLIASLFGLALVFAGYKFFRILLPIWGFFFGLWLGAQSIQVLFNQGFLATVTGWTVGFILGLIFAALSYPFYMFAVGIISASLGYFVVVGIWLWLRLPIGFVMWFVAILVASAFVVLTFLLKLQKWVIVVATSILGAGVMVGIITTLFNPRALFLENPVQVMLKTSPLLLILFLLLVIFGIIVQARSPRKVEEAVPMTRAQAAVPPTPAAAVPPMQAAAPSVSAVSPAVAVAGTAAAATGAVAAGAAAVAAEAKQEMVPPEPTLVQPEAPVASTPVEPVPPFEVASLDEIDKFKYNLEYIEGIGPVYAGKLRDIGVNNPLDLLEKGAFPKGREEIAAAAGISPALVLKWVNHVDLFRIKGVGSEYADLLEVAGVDTVVELATRVPENLYNKMLAVNEEKKLVRKPPVLSQVQDWVVQAKTLPRKVNY